MAWEWVSVRRFMSAHATGVVRLVGRNQNYVDRAECHTTYDRNASSAIKTQISANWKIVSPRKSSLIFLSDFDFASAASNTTIFHTFPAETSLGGRTRNCCFWHLPAGGNFGELWLSNFWLGLIRFNFSPFPSSVLVGGGKEDSLTNQN